MNKFLAIAVSLLLITVDTFARAGSSHSRSSSYSSRASSSSSYSRPAPNYSRPAQSYQRPTYTRPAPAAPKAVQPQPTVTKNITINKTTTVTSNRSNNNRNNDNDGGGSGFGGGNNNGGGGGMGIGGTILGVAGGVVAGNLLTSALMGDHRNDGHAPAGGYASTPAGYPVAGQPVAPAMAGAESGDYVTDGQGGYIPAPTTEAVVGQNGIATVPTPAPTSAVQATTFMEEDHYILRWLGYLLAGIILGILIGLALKKYLTYRARQKAMQDMIQAEQNLTKFEQIFKTIQSSYEAGSRISLIKLCTPEMYDLIIHAKDGNEDQGLMNVIDEVEVHSLVNISSWVQEGIKFQQVKIRFSMIDYMIDETGEVTHGSKDKRETAVEYWTFSSSSKNDWVLSSIKQHSGYVHQS